MDQVFDQVGESYDKAKEEEETSRLDKALEALRLKHLLIHLPGYAEANPLLSKHLPLTDHLKDDTQALIIAQCDNLYQHAVANSLDRDRYMQAWYTAVQVPEENLWKEKLKICQALANALKPAKIAVHSDSRKWLYHNCRIHLAQNFSTEALITKYDPYGRSIVSVFSILTMLKPMLESMTHKTLDIKIQYSIPYRIICPLVQPIYWAQGYQNDRPVPQDEVRAAYNKSYRKETSLVIPGTTKRDIFICRIFKETHKRKSDTENVWQAHVFIAVYDHATESQPALMFVLDNLSNQRLANYDKVPLFLASFWGLAEDNVLIRPAMCATGHMREDFLDTYDGASLSCTYSMYRHLILAHILPPFFMHYTDEIQTID